MTIQRFFSCLLAAVMLTALCAAPASAQDDRSETFTYTWCTPGSPDGTDYTAGDDYARFFTEQFNIQWDKINTTFDNHLERLRIWINSGDMPDLVNEWTFNFSELQSYAEQGLVGRLPDDWKERWPNLANAYARTGVGDEIEERLGGTYALPHPIFADHQPIEPLVWHYVAFMRKDWMEACGIEIKDSYTVAEIMDIARTIKEQDPGNVGANLKLINTHVAYMAYMFPYALYEGSWPDGVFFKDENGQIQWGPAQPEMLEALKVYQQAYREGLINPEFYTLKTNEGAEDFYTTGQSAITIECGMAVFMDRYRADFEQNLGLDYDEVVHTAVITGMDGKYHSAELANYSGALLLSPQLVEDTERFERLMDFLDYMCTEEAQLVLRLGLEGVDWQYAEDGSIELLTSGTVSEKYETAQRCWSNVYVLSDDFGIINPTYPEAYRERVVTLYELKHELGTDTVLPADWDLRFYTSPARDRISFVYPDEYAALILKDGDLEENWNAWVEEALNTYIQPVLDEMNELYGGK